MFNLLHTSKWKLWCTHSTGAYFVPLSYSPSAEVDTKTRLAAHSSSSRGEIRH